MPEESAQVACFYYIVDHPALQDLVPTITFVSVFVYVFFSVFFFVFVFLLLRFQLFFLCFSFLIKLRNNLSNHVLMRLKHTLINDKVSIILINDGKCLHQQLSAKEL